MSKMMFHGKEVTVVNTYNGKEGCACGCRGTYKDTGPAVTRRIRTVEAFVGPMRPDAANGRDAASYSTEPFCDERYVYVRDPSNDRVTTVYFK